MDTEGLYSHIKYNLVSLIVWNIPLDTGRKMNFQFTSCVYGDIFWIDTESLKNIELRTEVHNFRTPAVLEHRHTWNFAPEWNFQFQPGLKKLVSHVSFNPGRNEYFLLHFIPGWKMFAKICSIFYKNVLWENTFLMQLQDYIKTMMVEFINKRSKMFNFKTLKYFYWL